MEGNQIGVFIRDRRLELGMTQQRLADALGVTDKAVSKWERSVSYPDITLLRALADALGVNVSELLAGRREFAPSPVPPEVEDVVLDTVSYAESARRKNRGWRFWMFVAVSAGCLIAALVLLIVHLALHNEGTLVAIKCVAFGWGLCYPLLRTERPVWGFLIVLTATIVPFLGQFLPRWQYFWAYGIALLSVAYLWGVYLIWRKRPYRCWMALGWSILLGRGLSVAINLIVRSAAGVGANAMDVTVNTLVGGICFGVCLLVDRLCRRRRAEA